MGDFLKAVAKQYDTVTIGKDDVIPYWVDTGNYALNWAISGDFFRGYPGGKIVELFGEPSTGKSQLIYVAMANFQKQFADRAAIILDDTEDAFMPDFVAKQGADPDRIIRRLSSTVQEHFRSAFQGTKESPPMIPFILSKKKDARVMLALDSVAMLSTEHELDVGFDKDDMTKAKKIRAGIRMNWPYVSSNGILYIIANHVIADIGSRFGGKTTPGGKAIPFMSSVRLKLNVLKNRNSANEVVSIDTKVEVTKNKVSMPFRKVTVHIDFENGIDRMSGVVHALVNSGVIKRKYKEHLYLTDDRKIKENELTEEVFLELLREHKNEQQAAPAVEGA